MAGCRGDLACKQVRPKNAQRPAVEHRFGAETLADRLPYSSFEVFLA
jgi:hypothetical protein